MTATTAGPQITRQDMIDQVTVSLSRYADGYDIPAIVDDLISTHGVTDTSKIGDTRFLTACTKHQRREYWRRPSPRGRTPTVRPTTPTETSREEGEMTDPQYDEWPIEDADYFDCGGVVDGFGRVHSDADPGL